MHGVYHLAFKKRPHLQHRIFCSAAATEKNLG